MNQDNLKQAQKYISENQSGYSASQLADQLAQAGYEKEVIAEAFSQAGITQTQEGEVIKTKTSSDFWNFRNRRVYTSAGQKVGDFAFGFFGPFILSFFIYLFFNILAAIFRILNILSFYFLPLILLIFYIWATVYLWKRRRFVAIGMLVSILISLIPAFILVIVVLSFASS